MIVELSIDFSNKIMQKLKLKRKTKKKEIVVVEKKSKTSQNLALAAVQKHLQAIKLKEWLVMAGFVGGSSLLRAGMQPFPNIEPLTSILLIIDHSHISKNTYYFNVISSRQYLTLPTPGLSEFPSNDKPYEEGN